MSEETTYLVDGEPCGFYSADGKLYLTRCPKCKRENYAMAVSSGQCAWCGWKEASGE